MPIYEYKCNDCGEVFEQIQKFSDEALKECILCSGKNVEKLISQSSFLLKGSGWYLTDYAREGGKNSKDTKETDSKDQDAKNKDTMKPECKNCPSSC